MLLKNAPKNYSELAAPLPENVRFEKALTKETDIVHIFSERKALLRAGARALAAFVHEKQRSNLGVMAEEGVEGAN